MTNPKQLNFNDLPNTVLSLLVIALGVTVIMTTIDVFKFSYLKPSQSILKNAILPFYHLSFTTLIIVIIILHLQSSSSDNDST